MNCPYCGKEMTPGEILGDARSSVRFQPEGVKYTFGDTLCGIGKLTALRTKCVTFHLPANYCSHCRKLIIDTEVAR